MAIIKQLPPNQAGVSSTYHRVETIVIERGNNQAVVKVVMGHYLSGDIREEEKNKGGTKKLGGSEIMLTLSDFPEYVTQEMVGKTIAETIMAGIYQAVSSTSLYSGGKNDSPLNGG